MYVIFFFQINIDYDLIFPDAATVDLQFDWFQFMDRVLALKSSSIRDKKALQLLETLRIADNSNGKMTNL